MSTTNEGDEMLAAIARLDQALRGVLSVLEESTSDSAALVRSWRRCEVEQAAVRAREPGIVSLPGDERERVLSALRAVARLNAVAADLMRREAEGVRTSLGAVAAARRLARGQVSRATSAGGSVDIAG